MLQKKREKKIHQSKIGGKQKKNRKRKKGKYRKVLWTRQCLNNMQNYQKKKSNKEGLVCVETLCMPVTIPERFELDAFELHELENAGR